MVSHVDGIIIESPQSFLLYPRSASSSRVSNIDTRHDLHATHVLHDEDIDGVAKVGLIKQSHSKLRES